MVNMFNREDVVLFPQGKKEYMLGFVLYASHKFATVVTIDGIQHTVYTHQCKFIGHVRNNEGTNGNARYVQSH